MLPHLFDVPLVAGLNARVFARFQLDYAAGNNFTSAADAAKGPL